ncbi:MAG: PTS beta-glucoside transporter subunit IIABC [Candidatus Puniceispirillum sp.]
MPVSQNSPVEQDDKNPFKDMGFITFWVVSTVFYLTFPISLLLCYLTMGSVRTKQLLLALVNDFLQTIMILIVVVAILIWLAFHYIAPLFGG